MVIHALAAIPSIHSAAARCLRARTPRGIWLYATSRTRPCQKEYSTSFATEEPRARRTELLAAQARVGPPPRLHRSSPPIEATAPAQKTLPRTARSWRIPSDPDPACRGGPRSALGLSPGARDRRSAAERFPLAISRGRSASARLLCVGGFPPARSSSAVCVSTGRTLCSSSAEISCASRSGREAAARSSSNYGLPPPQPGSRSKSSGRRGAHDE